MSNYKRLLSQLGNDTALNRTTVAASISTALSTPAVAAAVAAAVVSCPEPVDYKISDFIACLKTACMDNVVVSPFMRTLPFTGVPGPWLRLRRSRRRPCPFPSLAQDVKAEWGVLGISDSSL